jgi:hypothetical protein
MSIKVRAPLACRIAGIDRDRFNEAVAKGDYPGAPPAGSGKTRIFQMHDLIALFIYGRLLEIGVAARSAGEFAKEISGLARHAEGKASTICACFIKTADGSGYFRLSDPTVHDESAREKLDVIEPVPSYGGAALFSINWCLSNIRKIIQDGIEDWKSAIGEEEVIG